jgi:hypothetical protein
LTRFSKYGENRRRGEKDPGYNSIKQQLLSQILEYTDKFGNLRYVTTDRIRGAPKIFKVRIGGKIVPMSAKKWADKYPQIFDDAYNYGAEGHARLGRLSKDTPPKQPPPPSPKDSDKDRKKDDKKKDDKKDDTKDDGPSPPPGAGGISIHQDLKQLREEQAQKDREAQEEQRQKEFQDRMAQLNAEEQQIRDRMAAESLSASDVLFHQLRLLTLQEQKKKLEQEETEHRSDLTTQEQEQTDILSQVHTLLPRERKEGDSHMSTPTPTPQPAPAPILRSPRQSPRSEDTTPNILGKWGKIKFNRQTIDTAIERLLELKSKAIPGTSTGSKTGKGKTRVTEQPSATEQTEEEQKPNVSPSSFSAVLKPPQPKTDTTTTETEQTQEQSQTEAMLLNPPSITEPVVPSSSREDILRGERQREIEEQQRRLEQQQKEMQEFERINTIRQQEAVIARFKEADEARNSMKVDLGSIPITTVVSTPAPGGGDPDRPGADTAVIPQPMGIPVVANQFAEIDEQQKRLNQQLETWEKFKRYMEQTMVENQRLGQQIVGNTFPIGTTPTAPTTTNTAASPPSGPPPSGPEPEADSDVGSFRGESEKEDEPEERGPESETDGEGEEPPSEEPPPSSTPQSNWPLLFTPPTVFRAPDTEEARRNGGYNPASDVLHVPMMWRSLHSQLREALIGLPRSQAHARARNARSSDFAPERNPYPHIP